MTKGIDTTFLRTDRKEAANKGRAIAGGVLRRHICASWKFSSQNEV
jgi:hypothetical protein